MHLRLVSAAKSAQIRGNHPVPCLDQCGHLSVVYIRVNKGSYKSVMHVTGRVQLHCRGPPGVAVYLVPPDLGRVWEPVQHQDGRRACALIHDAKLEGCAIAGGPRQSQHLVGQRWCLGSARFSSCRSSSCALHSTRGSLDLSRDLVNVLQTQAVLFCLSRGKCCTLVFKHAR